ncbi:Maf family protein [Pengzhenrongella frigida]|uniref:Nucleoside triphosphate pyrophosphatase n=1 Tax=Pengzhenrongella frigida TaxID=1259133 RepID=A0A4Q5N411_9MICO|nr:nucleoside triphosphate pyrophosphatase [Cellulomonas sp. HLT2-17]RYV52023.1 septum formation inhibitor Maf [Cellulomonas sp. HLT2-17]
MTRLLLASASPARRATLAGAGIDALVATSRVDEEAELTAATERFGALEPADAVLVLAHAKAQWVVEHRPTPEAEAEADVSVAGQDPASDLIVIGCDSMLELDGEIFGKPADAAQAGARWRTMRGRSAVLHTGHWLIDDRDPAAGGTGGTLGATSSTVVHFADLTDAEIDAYVATGEPLAVAGAFTVDGLGGAFVTGIEGDYHGVVGLSLPLLRELLGELGVTIPELWRQAAGVVA